MKAIRMRSIQSQPAGCWFMIGWCLSPYPSRLKVDLYHLLRFRCSYAYKRWCIFAALLPLSLNIVPKLTNYSIYSHPDVSEVGKAWKAVVLKKSFLGQISPPLLERCRPTKLLRMFEKFAFYSLISSHHFLLVLSQHSWSRIHYFTLLDGKGIKPFPSLAPFNETGVELYAQ